MIGVVKFLLDYHHDTFQAFLFAPVVCIFVREPLGCRPINERIWVVHHPSL